MEQSLGYRPAMLLDEEFFSGPTSARGRTYVFLQGITPGGSRFQSFTLVLILINVVCFVLSTDPDVNQGWLPHAFTVVELLTAAVFSVEYIVRAWSVVEHTAADGSRPYMGWAGRLKWCLTDFYSWVDLAAIVPTIIDQIFPQNLPATQFIRLLRVFSILRVEGRYLEAFTAFDDILAANAQLLLASGFVGATLWVILASLYHVIERDNPAMVWVHPGCMPPVGTHQGGDGILEYSDGWMGIDDADGRIADTDIINSVIASPLRTRMDRDGERISSAGPALPPCVNRFHSIPSAAYFALLNLFGEFPLLANHRLAGRLVASFAAVVAVAVFAVPTGILGSGFQDMVEQRKRDDVGVGSGYSSLHESPRAGPTWMFSRSGVPLLGPSLRGSRLQRMLEGKGQLGSLYKWVTYATIMLAAAAISASTLPGLQLGHAGSGKAGRGGGGYHNAGTVLAVLGAVEAVCALLFTIDVVLRVCMAAGVGRGVTCAPDAPGAWGGIARYVTSFPGLVDIAVVVPFLVRVALSSRPLTHQSPTALAALSVGVLCVLKAERYLLAFSVFDDVIRANGPVLAITGFATLVVWVLASSLMYFAERDNPDLDVRQHYRSVPDAMWLTLLNLSGESPLCDYSTAGRIITALVGLFAVGLFSIPVGVLGAGFEEWVSRQNEEMLAAAKQKRSAADDSRNRQLINDQEAVKAAQRRRYTQDVPAGGQGGGQGADVHGNGGTGELLLSEGRDGWQSYARGYRLFLFLEGGTPRGKRFQGLIVFLIVVTVLESILSTVDSIQGNYYVREAFEVVEWGAVAVFTVEYLLRLYASAWDPRWAHLPPWLARARYLVSFYAIVDALAVFPKYLSYISVVADRYDEVLRLLRLLRLLRVDKYLPSVTLIDDVFRIQKTALLLSGYAAASLWAIFAALMWLTERHDDVEDSGRLQSDRFASIPSSLPYTLVLLTGDYPLTDFTTAGKLACGAMLLAAVGVVSVPSGLIASGFVDVLQEEREERRERRRAAATKLQGAVKGHLTRLKLGRLATTVLTARREQLVAEHRARRTAPLARLCHWLYMTYCGSSLHSRTYQAFMTWLILVNAVLVIVESESQVAAWIGRDTALVVYNVLEAASVAVFTLDYACRLLAASCNRVYRYSPWRYATSFYGLVDLLSIVPWYVEQSFWITRIRCDATSFRVLRLLRLLQLERFVSAFTLMDDVFYRSRDTLACAGLLAVIILVAGSTLFYLVEPRGSHGGAFDSIPSAMYYCCVFLGGEWAVIDFTIPGQVVCCLFCLLGITLFAIPLGTLFEAFGDTLSEVGGIKKDTMSSRRQ
eukprot:jgi/Mesvir1/16808/Mv15172-RA.1